MVVQLYFLKNTVSYVNTLFQESFLIVVKGSILNQLFVIAGVYLQSVTTQLDCVKVYKTQLASLSGIIDVADTIVIGVQIN